MLLAQTTDKPAFWQWALALLLFITGVVVAGFLATLIGRLIKRHLGEHLQNVAHKLVFWSLSLLVLILCLDNLGIDITSVIAAAGILGIAIGFAAQTSFSNMISGIFLLFEQPFRVGDAIKVGETMGMVLSIDLLSVKLRQFDNQFIRVPNESFLKNNVTNLTKYDIRRFDMIVGIAYRENIRKAQEVLERVVEQDPEVLKKPDPQVLVDEFAASSVNLRVRVWFDRTEFIEARSELMADMKEALDEEGIEIPYPHLMHYASDELLEALDNQPSPPEQHVRDSEQA